MADDSFGFHMKAAVMRNALSVFTSSVPSRRELFIQIDNLENLAKKFDKKFTWKFVLSTPQEKYRNSKASDMHRLTLQSKLVDDLFARMIEEILLHGNQKMIPVKRKAFKMRARQFTAKFNRRIQQDVKRLREEQQQNALREFLPSELSSGDKPKEK
jgi:hypothetical protein